MADTHSISPAFAKMSSAVRPTLDRRDIPAIAALMAIVVGLFWRALFTSDMLYFRDVYNYSYPHAKLIQEICRGGHLPYWNPLLNWGQPLLSNPNTLFLYPYTLLIILLPINIAYPLHYVVHISIAAVGLYALARHWGQSRLAAFFAAGFFAFSGPVLSLGNFYNMVACVAWMPWALFFTDAALERRSIRSWVALTLIFALQFLAGEPMTLMATFGLATAYAFHRAGEWRRPLAPANLRILACFLAVGVAMMALAAIQFFPALQLLSNSRRGSGLAFWRAGYWSFHPLLFLEFVLPDFFGPPFGEVAPWKLSLNSDAVPLLLSYFLGFIPLFFALAGWALGRDRRRNFTAGAAIVFLLLALGRFTPLYKLLFWSLPPLRLVRFPVKLLVTAVLLLALLAGWGFDRLKRDDVGKSQNAKLMFPLGLILATSLLVWTFSWIHPGWIVAPAERILVNANRAFVVPPDKPLSSDEVGGAMRFFLAMVRIHFPALIGYSIGGLAWLAALKRGRKWAGRATPWIALAGLIILVSTTYKVNPVAPRTFYDYQPPVLAHMDRISGPHRFCDIAHDRRAVHQAPALSEFINFDSVPETAGFSRPLLSAFRERILLSSGTMLTGLESATLSDVDSSVSEPYYEFWSFERAQAGDAVRYDCLLGRANVKYLISRTREDSPEAREISEIFNGSPAPSFLYQDLCAVPRVYAAGAAQFSSSAEETLRKLSDPEFDATGNVILPAGMVTATGGGEPGSAGAVEIAERQAGAVTLRASLSRPGYVVLLDRFDPNWHATLDGKEIPILAANVMFRAVECPAGRHEIRFFYRQKGLAAGFIVSLATLILLSLLYCWNPRCIVSTNIEM